MKGSLFCAVEEEEDVDENVGRVGVEGEAEGGIVGGDGKEYIDLSSDRVFVSVRD
jgi:hypothetical protein